MSPALLQFLLYALEEAVNLEPTLAAGIQSIFSSGAPTAADFQNLRQQILTPYSTYDPTPLPTAPALTTSQQPSAPAAISPTSETLPTPSASPAASLSPAPSSSASPAAAADPVSLPDQAAASSAAPAIAAAANPSQPLVHPALTPGAVV